SLYLFEGYDMEEIASILKIRPSSVRSQYLRAKRKLLDIIAANKENG
ncbi:RNA polymerase sigma factor, partial [Parabacteroides sp.]